jgi:hypothetical protein
MNQTNEKVYVNTYFRINTLAYGHKAGYNYSEFSNKENEKNFNQDIINIFTNLGFSIIEPDSFGFCYEVVKGSEKLYCHPQNISGEVLESSIPVIEEALRKAETFKLYNIDQYDKVYDMDKNEVLQVLNRDYKEETIDRIIKACKTTRKTKFVGITTRNNSPVKTIVEREGNGAYSQFIQNIIGELLEQGLLIQMKTHKGFEDYYRSLNKTEMKQWEKKNGKFEIEVKEPEYKSVFA